MNKISKKIVFVFFLLFICFQPVVFANYHTIHKTVTDPNTGIITYTQESWTNKTGREEGKTLPIPIPPNKKAYLEVSLDQLYNWFNYAYASFKHGDTVLASTKGTRTWNGMVYDNNYYIYTYAHKTRSLGDAKAWATVTIYPYFTLDISALNANCGAIYIDNNHYDAGQNYEYFAGTTVSLKAEAKPGCSFIRWEGSVSSTSPTINVRMNNDKNIKAVFADIHVNDVSNSDTPITHIGRNIRIDWNDVVDLSGIKEYQVMVTENDQEPINLDGMIRVSNSEIVLKNLSSKKSYYGWIKAVDNAGNVSKNWLKIGPFSPEPESPEIENCTPVAKIENNKPYYEIKLSIKPVDARQFIIERREISSSSWIKKVFTYEELMANSFKIVDREGLIKHGMYQYKITTKNALGLPKNPTEIFYPQIVSIPNIIASYQINAPLDGMVTNKTQHRFNVTPKRDIEGDEIRFRVLYSLKNEDRIYVSSASMQQEEVEITFPSEGEWRWWLEIAEYDNRGNLIPGTMKETKACSIFIDCSPPTGEFIFKSLDGDVISRYTNNVNIKLGNINLRDSSGIIKSGLAGINLWNGSLRPNKFHSVKIDSLKTINDNILTAIASGSHGLHIDIDSGLETPLIEVTIDELMWRFSGGNDGSRTVSMEIVDIVGNCSAVINKSIIYDHTPPQSPKDLQLTGGRNKLSIEWAQAEDGGKSEARSGVRGYILSYTRSSNGKEVSNIFIEQSSKPTFTISNLDDNEKVEVKIKTVDHAGNYSASELKGEGYSLAEIGKITGITFKPYEASLSIKKVKAAKYMIRRWTVQVGADGKEIPVGQKDSNWYPISTLTFIDRDLTPHAKYYYSIITCNGRGEVESNIDWDKVAFVVPNQTPSEPEPDEFTYVNKIPFKLSTKSASDPDGDQLTYCFSLKDDQGRLLLDKAPSDNQEDPDGLSYIITSELINSEHDGKTFTWQVGVTDGYTYIFSIEKQFTVDLSKPEIHITPEDTSNYVSKLDLKITVTDKTSGLQYIEYYWNQEELLPEEREIHVIGVPEGNKEHQFTITKGPDGINKLHLIAKDVAGNEQTKTIVCRLDSSPPTLSNLKVQGKNVDGRLYTAHANSITAEWELEEDRTNIDYFRYAIITPEEINSLETLPLDRFKVIDEYFPRHRKKFAQVAEAAWLEENMTYHFVVEAFNTVGLSTGLHVSPGVTIDSKPPEIEKISPEPVRIYQNKSYLSSFSNLQLKVEVDDKGGSGIKTVHFALLDRLPIEENVTWFDSIEELKTHLIPTDGQVYYLAVRATDKLDLVNTNYSAPLIIDQSPPEVNELLAGNKLEISGSEKLYQIRPGSFIPISFLIEDEVEIEEIRYSIGSRPGQNDVSRGFYPETEGWVTLDNLSKRQQIRIEENLSDGIYYINLRVKNAAGLFTEKASNPIKVDSNLAVGPVVWDDGQYTASNNELHFTWTFDDKTKEVIGYDYRLLTLSQGQPVTVVDWQRIFGAEKSERYSHLLTNLNLENGKEYYIAIRGVYSDGNLSAEGMTDGIIIDTTPPDEVFIDDGTYCTSDQVYLRWGASDPESGISSYQVQIGTTPGGDQVTKGWLNLDQSGAGSIQGLALTDHNELTYYVTLRVINGAGLIREISSNGFRVDNTPPPIPAVLDDGRYTNRRHLDFNWKWTAVDPESGNAEYKIALLTTREVGAATQWESVGTETAITFNADLQEGVWYYLAVQAVNGAGLSSIGFSDGILIDTTAPSPPKITDETDYLRIDPSGYTALRATFTASDDESDIDYYEYSVGTLAHPEEFLGGKIEKSEIVTEALPLEPGKIYFFTVRAINNAGLVSMEGRSDGLMIIDGYPEIINVDDFGDYTTFNDQIIVAWDCKQTGFAPINYYQIELSTDERNWLKVKNVKEKQVVITPADLGWDRFKDGESYYVSIRGVNQAGVETPLENAGITNGIKVDSSPPAVEDLRILHPDPYTTNHFKIHLQASDVHSGITAYKFAVGTTRGGTEVTKGWILRENTLQNYEEYFDLELKHNTCYYVTFQARNGTRLWSQPVSDQGVIADLTPPEITAFTCEDYINATKKINLFWKAEDPETGVTGYRYQLVAQLEDLDWNKSPVFQTVGNECNVLVPVDEDLITEEARYYLALQVRNRLGLWSTASLRELVVDTVSPTITFDSTGEIVTNDGVAQVLWKVSEPAEVHQVLYILTPGSEPEYISGVTVVVSEFMRPHRYNFAQSGQEPASYRLVLTATDPAGNTGIPAAQQIRINAKPKVNLGLDRSVFKGRELILTPSVDDPDGRITTYYWNFGDGRTSTEVEPKHIYTEIGEYELTLTCTDNDGGAGSDTITVTVTNTFSGSLALDETWSGKVKLWDTVTVPSGISLAIEPGTTVEVPPDKALVIKGSLEVHGRKGQEVLLTIDPNYSARMKWKGLRIDPGADGVRIINTLVNRAERGITVVESAPYLEGVELAENLVGLHLYNSSPIIKNCKINNNELYGIKEDENCTPILTGNHFFNNLAGDYYDSELTILSPKELGELNNED